MTDKSELPTVVIAAAVLFSLYAWIVFVTTFSHPGTIGLNLNAPGTDWMVFYGAARWWLAGNLGQIFHGQAFTDYLNSAFSWWLSEPMPFRPWVYPPSYLLLILPFGKLTLLQSYFAFQAVTATMLVIALWFNPDRPNRARTVAAGALLCPAAAFNVAAGQNAFLVAALLIGGFRLLRKQPLLGGLVLGLATFKPQFWMLVPVALLAAREWRAIAASVAGAAAFAAISASALGLDIWWKWLHFALTAYWNPDARWVLNARLYGDSVWASLVVSGAPDWVANVLQNAAIFLAAGAVYKSFRLPLSADRKLAVLLAATIFAAPHSSIHDTVMLAVAALLWIYGTPQDGLRTSKWLIAILLWLAPLFNPPETMPLGRLTPLLILVFIATVLFDGHRSVARARPDKMNAATPTMLSDRHDSLALHVEPEIEDGRAVGDPAG